MDIKGVDLEGEKVYMSADFIEMMWLRTHFLLDVLRHGYHILFTVKFLDVFGPAQNQNSMRGANTLC